MTTPEPGELRRPDLVLAAMAAQHPFDVPRALLGLVEGAHDSQRLTRSTVLWTRPPLESSTGYELADRSLDRLAVPTHCTGVLPIVVAVVVRPGPCWWSWDESEVLLGLRYANHPARVLQAGVITVTEGGWYDPLDQLAGPSPRARWTSLAAA